ncbi:MAG: protein-glutamate O-methyltransferase CheR, partial [Oscillospiraceae bacterium]
MEDAKTPVTAPASSSATGLIHITDREFTELTTYIQRKYGINLTKKRVLIEGRMSNMLRERGLPTFRAYMDILFKDNSGSEVTNLLNKLTTNHSYFMREQEHWDYLVGSVLPELEALHAQTKDLRIWSAGCSAGQEAYTLAMAIDEYFGMKKSGWDTTILATDISMNVLEKAKLAIYPADNIKDVPSRWVQKYFVKLPDGNYQVCDKIRKEVVFKPFNLMEKFTFPKPFDLILCRNVMIYFDAPTKDALVGRFYGHTSEKGFFF